VQLLQQPIASTILLQRFPLKPKLLKPLLQRLQEVNEAAIAAIVSATVSLLINTENTTQLQKNFRRA